MLPRGFSLVAGHDPTPHCSPGARALLFGTSITYPSPGPQRLRTNQMTQEPERYRWLTIWRAVLVIGIAAAIVIALLWSLDGL